LNAGEAGLELAEECPLPVRQVRKIGKTTFSASFPARFRVNSFLFFRAAFFPAAIPGVFRNKSRFLSS
jgi:hypothetical protein